MRPVNADEIKALAAELRVEIREQLLEEERKREADEFVKWEARTIDRKSETIDQLNAEIVRLQEDASELNATVKRWPVLAEAVAFLDGRITHVVHTSYRVAIETIDEACTRKDSYGRREYRMLGLIPTHDRNGVFNINTYGDGSGTWDSLISCESLEEAHKVVRRLFDEDVSLWRNRDAVRSGGKQQPKTTVHAWRAYAETGVYLEWPEDLVSYLNDMVTGELQKQVDEARLSFRKAEAALDNRDLFEAFTSHNAGYGGGGDG